ncbi:MAG: anthranilate phosphoribosyltransferase [Chloroflexi bacterium]|nr:anthranilate phosphoribosyltransferase [Chloroflexota bacterium]
MIRDAIGKLVEGRSLSEEEARAVMGQVMAGEATPAQIAAWLVALRLKGETPEELLGMVRAMRERAVPVETAGDPIDTCGTGGDASGSYNISTASAIVAAAAGIKVAKHGNRSASSKCGSADVLEALGVRIALTPQQASRCLDEAGITFLFAQAYHPAMKYVAPVRTEIGVRTVFNFLGPLANPAGVRRQVLGVALSEIAPKMASILNDLGAVHALVVHGEDGMDEVSLGGATSVYEVRDGAVRSYAITPEELGLPRAGRSDLAGGDRDENAAIIRRLLDGERGPKRDALLANASAALLVGDKAKDWKEGVALAADVIDSGAAKQKLEEFVRCSRDEG